MDYEKIAFYITIVGAVILLFHVWQSRQKKIIQNTITSQLVKSDGSGSMYIPKKIFQIMIPSKENLNPMIKKNIAYIKRLNPNWSYRLFDADDIDEYLRLYYPQYVKIYNMINPTYLAARADFFRYLLIYREGGAYFDIKSAPVYPLDQILYQTDEYIISHWEGRNFSPRLNLSNGEIQQWFIIARPHHPFLAAVINKVVQNILNYQYDETIPSKIDVLETTGPLAYTDAIMPLLSQYPYRAVQSNEFIGIVYNNLTSATSGYKNIIYDQKKKYYGNIHEPLILFD